MDEIGLRNWTIRPSNGGVCVDGLRIDNLNGQYWHSSTIAKRIERDLLETISGSRYRLHGRLNTSYAEEMSEYLRSVTAKFERGFPFKWKYIVNAAKRDAANILNEEPPKTSDVKASASLSIVSNQPKMNRSRSGRVLVCPSRFGDEEPKSLRSPTNGCLTRSQMANVLKTQNGVKLNDKPNPHSTCLDDGLDDTVNDTIFALRKISLPGGLLFGKRKRSPSSSKATTKKRKIDDKKSVTIDTFEMPEFEGSDRISKGSSFPRKTGGKTLDALTVENPVEPKKKDESDSIETVSLIQLTSFRGNKVDDADDSPFKEAIMNSKRKPVATKAESATELRESSSNKSKPSKAVSKRQKSSHSTVSTGADSKSDKVTGSRKPQSTSRGRTASKQSDSAAGGDSVGRVAEAKVAVTDDFSSGADSRRRSKSAPVALNDVFREQKTHNLGKGVKKSGQNEKSQKAAPEKKHDPKLASADRKNEIKAVEEYEQMMVQCVQSKKGFTNVKTYKAVEKLISDAPVPEEKSVNACKKRDVEVAVEKPNSKRIVNSLEQLKEKQISTGNDQKVDTKQKQCKTSDSRSQKVQHTEEHKKTVVKSKKSVLKELDMEVEMEKRSPETVILCPEQLDEKQVSAENDEKAEAKQKQSKSSGSRSRKVQEPKETNIKPKKNAFKESDMEVEEEKSRPETIIVHCQEQMNVKQISTEDKEKVETKQKQCKTSGSKSRKAQEAGECKESETKSKKNVCKEREMEIEAEKSDRKKIIVCLERLDDKQISSDSNKKSDAAQKRHPTSNSRCKKAKELVEESKETKIKPVKSGGTSAVQRSDRLEAITEVDPKKPNVDPKKLNETGTAARNQKQTKNIDTKSTAPSAKSKKASKQITSNDLISADKNDNPKSDDSRKQMTSSSAVANEKIAVTKNNDDSLLAKKSQVMNIKLLGGRGTLKRQKALKQLIKDNLHCSESNDFFSSTPFKNVQRKPFVIPELLDDGDDLFSESNRNCAVLSKNTDITPHGLCRAMDYSGNRTAFATPSLPVTPSGVPPARVQDEAYIFRMKKKSYFARQKGLKSRKILKKPPSAPKTIGLSAIDDQLLQMKQTEEQDSEVKDDYFEEE